MLATQAGERIQRQEYQQRYAPPARRQESEKLPAGKCATCAFGKPNPAAATGWECAAAKAMSCKPWGAAAGWVLRGSEPKPEPKPACPCLPGALCRRHEAEYQAHLAELRRRKRRLENAKHYRARPLVTCSNCGRADKAYNVARQLCSACYKHARRYGALPETAPRMNPRTPEERAAARLTLPERRLEKRRAWYRRMAANPETCSNCGEIRSIANKATGNCTSCYRYKLRTGRARPIPSEHRPAS